LFLTLFLFNHIGYKCWFYYLQQKEQAFFEERLDKEEYNEKDLITFKVPLNIPYQVNQREFERVDGEITINGTIYKYVKRKIEDGELVLLCLPYYKKMKLVKASADFASHYNDLSPSGKKENSPSPAKNMSLSEYEENTHWTILQQSCLLTTQHSLFILPDLTRGHTDFPPRPPKLA